jgi:FkbM family methyltransferase
VGLYGAYALACYPDAEVIAFEPDPVNAAVVRRLIAVNGLGARWTLVEAAAAASDGVARFRAAGTDGMLADDGQLDVTTVDVMPLLAACDLVKMDIEGGEWRILGDPRFAECGPPTLVMEYHRDSCQERNGNDHPRDDPNPRRLAVHLLEAAGYTITRLVDTPSWSSGAIWASRPGPVDLLASRRAA